MGVLSSAVSSFINPIMGAAGNRVSDKIFGVPKIPSPPSGVEVGQWEKDRMDVMYPKLTQWERAGVSSPGGQVFGSTVSGNTAGAQMKNEQSMLTKQKMFDFGLQMESKKMDYDREEKLGDRSNVASLLSKEADLGYSPENLGTLADAYYRIMKQNRVPTDRLGNADNVSDDERRRQSEMREVEMIEKKFGAFKPIVNLIRDSARNKAQIESYSSQMNQRKKEISDNESRREKNLELQRVFSEIRSNRDRSSGRFYHPRRRINVTVN